MQEHHKRAPQSVRTTWPLTTSTALSSRTPQIWVIQIHNQWIVSDARGTFQCVIYTSETTSTVVVMGWETCVLFFNLGNHDSKVFFFFFFMSAECSELVLCFGDSWLCHLALLSIDSSGKTVLLVNKFRKNSGEILFLVVDMSTFLTVAVNWQLLSSVRMIGSLCFW